MTIMNSPNELSFLPDDYLAQKARRRANILCGIVSVLVLVGIGSAFWMTKKAVGLVEKQYADVEAKYTEAARRIEQAKKINEQQQRIWHHAKLAASLVEKVPRSNLLAEITKGLPSGTWLLDMALVSNEHQEAPAAGGTAFEQKRAEIEAKIKAADFGPKPLRYDVKIRVTGVAQTDVQVAQLMSRLSHSSIFQDVNLVYSEAWVPPGHESDKQKGESLRKWQIEMMLNPDAEIDDKGGKSAAVELKQ